MIVNLSAFVFVLGLTFLHSIFGLYSGLINVFCSIAALAVSLGYFELVNDLLTGTFHLHSAYTEPATLVLLFVVTLGVLRMLADMFIRGNVRVPMYIDWGGGAVCGFINAQICVGIMVLGFLMLQFGGRVGMFSRYERDPDDVVDPQTQRVEFERHDLLLKSDQFAVGLFNLLSGGSMAGGTTFKSIYPDFPEWVFWSGNTVQHESLTAPIRDEQSDGFKNGIAVDSWWRQTAGVAGRYRKRLPSRDYPTPDYDPMTYQALAGNELIGVRLLLKQSSADKGGKRDDPVHRFRPTMIRLVGDVGDEPRQYRAELIGGADKRIGDSLRIVDIDANFSIAAAGENSIDVYFDVDARFKPRFIEYRRHARATVPESKRLESPPDERLAAASDEGDAQPSRGRGRSSGPARFLDIIDRNFTGQIDMLPVELAVTQLGFEAETSGEMLTSGRVMGSVSALSQGGSRVTKFNVPAGKRIFQVKAQARQAASLFGQVFNFVGAIVNQYQCVTTNGQQYQLCGYYAIVKRDGEDYIELFYAPDPGAVNYQNRLDFQTTGLRGMLKNQADAYVGLIFLVDPGACVNRIQTQGGRGRIDLGQDYCVSN